MPIYEYRCSQCGHELEVLQKLSEAPLRTCPECRQETLAKQISAAGFQLKGSGWYATDFRNGGKPAKTTGASAEAKGESKGEGASGSKSEGASGSKSEGASESKSDSKKEAGAPAAGCGTNCACH